MLTKSGDRRPLRLYYFERLRFADEMPVILEKRYVVAAPPGLTSADLQVLYLFGPTGIASQRSGRKHSSGEHSWRGRAPYRRKAARHAGVPLIPFRRKRCGANALYRGDFYEFHSRRDSTRGLRLGQVSGNLKPQSRSLSNPMKAKTLPDDKLFLS